MRTTTRLLGQPLRARARFHGAEYSASARLRTLRADRVLLSLVAILGVGLGLRIWFTLVWTPAITGYSDSGIYFTDSVKSLWTDPIRTQGYSMFLRVLHWISPHLILVTIVQHGLGLIAAVAIFLAVRRCGVPRWLGLIPAAILALGGDELFLEHAALSDALFTFLIVLVMYFALRAAPTRGHSGRLLATRGSARWAFVAGVCSGLIVWDRDAGLAMLPVVPLWLAFSVGRPTRRTLAIGALSLVASLATIGVYVEWRHAESGLSGLTTNSGWDLYGRAAPWANCKKFTPPPGTRALCETTPPSKRPADTSGGYVYDPRDPAQRLFGAPYEVSKYPHAMQRLRSWSEAAILGEPLEYLHAVWLDTIRLFDPNARSYGDLSADQMVAFFLYGPTGSHGKNEFVEYWQKPLYPHDPPAHHGDIAPLKKWERLTRIDGAWMGLLLALCLAGPWLLGGRVRRRAGRARAGMLLFATTALVLLFFPILVNGYDYRFVIPAFAPLVAAGTLAAWGLAVRIRARMPVARAIHDDQRDHDAAPGAVHTPAAARSRGGLGARSSGSRA